MHDARPAAADAAQRQAADVDPAAVGAVPGCVDALPAGPAGARDGPEQPWRLGAGQNNHLTKQLDHAGHDGDDSDEDHPDEDIHDENVDDEDVDEKDHPDNDVDEARDHAQTGI